MKPTAALSASRARTRLLTTVPTGLLPAPGRGRDRRRTTAWARVAAAVLGAVPAVVVRLSGIHLAPLGAVVVFGAAIVATAFLLAWAAETAQMDIPGSLATAALAVIAVLPEYAVDLHFSYGAGHDPLQAQFAAANMTGSNRLLIGVGWPLVAFAALAAYRRRARRTAASPGTGAVSMEPARRVEVGFLAAACAFSFVIVATGVLAWWASPVLLGLFGLYIWRLSRQAKTEPHLIGVSAALATLTQVRRRAAVFSLFAIGAVIVASAAQPFADGLVSTGDQFGVDRFLLVQWVAPLASEAPELIVAALFAWRLRAGDALGTLLSSKVNQWTLLVGTIPLAYLAGGGRGAFALDPRQSEEFLLTATQALLALAVVMDLSLRRREAVALLLLFLVQIPFPQTAARLGLSGVYAVAALSILYRHRQQIPLVARAAFGPAPPLRSRDATVLPRDAVVPPQDVKRQTVTEGRP